MIKVLRATIVDQHKLLKELDELPKIGFRTAFDEEKRSELQELIDKREKALTDLLRRMLLWPVQHQNHYQLLDQFWAAGKYDESVFIMTKYPSNKGTPADIKLAAVIDAVCNAVRARNLKPRLAKDQKFHSQMWPNIELYMLGCARGIAIVESKHTSETNPNVALEWGWMRAMGREVHYLIEKNFGGERADFKGFISEEFDWDDPSTTIPPHVSAWFT